MSYLTRDDLAQNVASYLHRNDLQAQILDFINLATIRIGRDLRSAYNERSLVWNMPQNPANLPSDFRGIRSLSYDGNGGVVYVPPGNQREVARYAGARNGSSPLVYAIEGLTLRTSPTRTGDYNLLYWHEPAALTQPNSANPVLLAYPQLYLYAALMEGFFYTQDGEMYAAAKQNYMAELREINILSEQQRLGAAPAMGV